MKYTGLKEKGGMRGNGEREKRAIFRARAVLLPDCSLLKNGAIACEQGRIVAVEQFPQVGARFNYPVIDFGEAVILPGLINAHCHLEFTLPSGMIKPTSNFIAWLEQIIPAHSMMPPATLTELAVQGIVENVRNGTTTIADISTSDTSVAPLLDSFVRKAIFFEVLDIRAETAETSLAALEQRYNALGEMREASGVLLSRGIAPHAPYSVSEALLRAIVTWRVKTGARLAVHVAETLEEIALLRDGTGAMYEHFQQLDFLPSDWSPKGVSPVRYLYDLGVLDSRTLLAHCNYLTPEDIRLIAAAQSSVVYCPGSHRFFAHQRHLLPELLSAAVNVCLGTDSRASNDSLDMVREMRLVKEEFPDIAWEAILRLTTQNAARALGLEDAIGRISPGYAGDLTVLRPDSSACQPINRLVRDIFSDTPPICCATIVAGEVLFHST